jgi:CRISPR-associated protein Csn2
MYSYLEELFSTESLPFAYKDFFDISQLLKTIDLQISFQGENLAETIQDYLKILTEFQEIKLFVFVNLKCFLSTKDLAELFEFICYEKINILLLENHDQKPYNSNETVILFDKDLCRVL